LQQQDFLTVNVFSTAPRPFADKHSRPLQNQSLAKESRKAKTNTQSPINIWNDVRNDLQTTFDSIPKQDDRLLASITIDKGKKQHKFFIIRFCFCFVYYDWAAALGQACPQEYQGRDVRSKTR
jgi:hypothetical protein